MKRLDLILERLYELECDLSMLAHSPEPLDSREMARNLADRVQRIREERSTLVVTKVDRVAREITLDVEPMEES